MLVSHKKLIYANGAVRALPIKQHTWSTFMDHAAVSSNSMKRDGGAHGLCIAQSSHQTATNCESNQKWKSHVGATRSRRRLR